MCCVSFVYVFHLIKFVSFCCHRIFLANKDIQNDNRYVIQPSANNLSPCGKALSYDMSSVHVIGPMSLIL